jgi:hypothetical protein
MSLDPFKSYKDRAGDVWDYSGSSWAWHDADDPSIGHGGYSEKFVESCGAEEITPPASELASLRELLAGTDAALQKARAQRDDALTALAHLRPPVATTPVDPWGFTALRALPVGTVVRDKDGDLYAKMYGGVWVVLESPNATAYVGTGDDSSDLVRPVTVISTPNG